MGDDIWVYGYDPETKQQSSQLKESTLTKTKQTGQVQNATTKNAHGFFFQWCHWLRVCSSSYTTFWEAWEKMCNEKDQNCSTTATGCLHHDNVPTHTSLKMIIFVGGHPTSSILSWLSCLWLHHVHQGETEAEGPPFWQHRWNSNRITGSIGSLLEKDFFGASEA